MRDKEGNTHMKRMLLVAVAAIAVTTASEADPFSGAYGNTLTRTLPNGTKMIVYVNADQTWEQHTGAAVMKGTYAWKDATNVCFTLTDPAPAEPAKAINCFVATDDHKVGDIWTDPMPDGKGVITNVLTAGR